MQAACVAYAVPGSCVTTSKLIEYCLHLTGRCRHKSTPMAKQQHMAALMSQVRNPKDTHMLSSMTPSTPSNTWLDPAWGKHCSCAHTRFLCTHPSHFKPCVTSPHNSCGYCLQLGSSSSARHSRRCPHSFLPLQHLAGCNLTYLPTYLPTFSRIYLPTHLPTALQASFHPSCWACWTRQPRCGCRPPTRARCMRAMARSWTSWWHSWGAARPRGAGRWCCMSG